MTSPAFPLDQRDLSNNTGAFFPMGTTDKQLKNQ